MNRNRHIILAAALLACANLAWGANVAVDEIKTFAAGDTLKAGDMNQNFGALKQGVNSKQDLVTDKCNSGQAMKEIKPDGTVVCESVAGGTGDITAVTTPASSGLTGGVTSGDAVLAIDPAYVQRRVINTCTGLNQTIKTIAADGSVVCETILPPNPGDITAVNAGTGLTGGATSGDATLTVNTAVIQNRVTGMCDGAGQSIKTIAANGTVTCEFDDNSGGDITAVNAGAGLIGGAPTGEATLAVDPAYVQRRVSGACAAGNAVNTVNADGTVACEVIPQGDITAVTTPPSSGLSGGGDSGAVSLSVNTAVIQNRVTGMCDGAGQSIKTIAANGTVTCEFDDNSGGDITAVNAGAGLIGGALSGDATLAVDPAYVQRRVSNMCDVGAWIREIKLDGTITCEAAAVNAAQWSTLQTTITNLQTALVNANTAIVNLETTVKSHTTTLTTHTGQITTINNNSALDLGPYLTVATIDGKPKATFSGINLQLINGAGATSFANGLGNLIIGYDVARNDTTYFCSDGQYTDQTACEGASKTWAVSHKSGSHYLVIGDQNNYSQSGGMVVGNFNTSNRAGASVSGGSNNTASGFWSSVSGGNHNTASGNSSSVSGGNYNTANALQSSVSGGFNNTASGISSSVSGGVYNTASGGASHVSGGGNGAVVGGNIADQSYSSILGGVSQLTSQQSQTIPALP